MPLLKLDNVSLAYGHKPLLDGVTLEIRRGERVCLVGRNGEGKTTLLRTIMGEAIPDDGEVWLRDGIRVAHLAQEVSVVSNDSVFDVVAGGLPKMAALLSDYHCTVVALGELPPDTHSDELLRHMTDLQHELDVCGGWQVEQRVEMVLSRLHLDGDIPIQSLSGGWQRRAMLARALVCEPDILLLDEPTNHLDIEAITWMEDYMVNYPGALIFISHDRAFLRRLSSRIIELDRGKLTSFPGSYDDYLRRKQELLGIEKVQNARFDKNLSREEAWIRQGIKARRTRNEGRVRALQELRRQRSARQDRAGKARLSMVEADMSGKIVFDAEDVSYSYGDNKVINELTLRIMRGDRIGITGPNGAGKSTLLKLILGEIRKDSGRMRRGTKLQAAYFDQQRAQLDPKKSVMDNVADGSETVKINGRDRHVAGYLRSFLFPGERLRSPVSSLSGGERNRLLLARLFTQPANLLVLDEPTNDLDVETLELLEELLMEYDGTLLLVSHDRAFLDNVVTSTLVFEDDARIGEYLGGYSDWLRYREEHARDKPEKKQQPTATRKPATNPDNKPGSRPRKLSYKEQNELKGLPDIIEHLEEEQASLQDLVSDSAFYQKQPQEIAKTLARLESITNELGSCYNRWDELESAGKIADS
ncbi:MAG: ATP-binding cassette domain-containing protein [Gammaproteobacteria bacterium]|nr:MAG: ATP-binding cassette domain-containing protein [Gammaproteobacteria bacterium]